MLEITDLDAAYGRSKILHGVDLEVGDPETVCLMGRNGVGKTTLMKAIMGIVTPTAGRISFAGEDITGLPSHEICRHGIGYVPQERDIFPDLSVEQNLLVPRLGLGLDRDVSHIYDVFPMLEDRRRAQAGSLSGGQKQMLAIGRALSIRPTLLLLDEPSEGIQPSIVADIEALLADLQSDTSILLVEQNVEFARAVGDRCYIMQKGRIVTSGSPTALDLEDLITA